MFTSSYAHFPQCYISIPPPENIIIYGFLMFSGGIEIYYWKEVSKKDCSAKTGMSYLKHLFVIFLMKRKKAIFPI